MYLYGVTLIIVVVSNWSQKFSHHLWRCGFFHSTVHELDLELSKIFHYPNTQVVLSFCVTEGTDIAVCCSAHTVWKSFHIDYIFTALLFVFQCCPEQHCVYAIFKNSARGKLVSGPEKKKVSWNLFMYKCFLFNLFWFAFLGSNLKKCSHSSYILRSAIICVICETLLTSLYQFLSG